MRAPSLDDEHVFRESPLRFLGYANEVGEAFRSHIPRVAVRASYVISFGYGFVDAAWRSNFAHSRVTHLPPNQRRFVAAGAVAIHIFRTVKLKNTHQMYSSRLWRGSRLPA